MGSTLYSGVRERQVSSGVEDQLDATAGVELVAELVKLRKKRKISQEPVARAIGITQGRLSQIESLKTGVSLEATIRYAHAIGADIVIVQ